MFKFWGSAPRLLVPDNLKSGVHRASFYDPEVECGVRSYVAFEQNPRVLQREVLCERHIMRKLEGA
jgi:hypothetical protein